MRKTLAAAVVAAATILAVLAAASQPAHANFPWSPNGKLAFAIKDGSGVSNIYSVRPDGDGLLRLTNTPAFDLCPDYSRDGRLITFCSNRSGSFQIWAMNADGSNVHIVTNGNRFIFPDYSPDASKIVFSGTASTTDVNQNVYMINADGSGLKQLTTAGNNQYATFSPDGKEIAFISDRTGIEQVWMMNADGSSQTQLSHSGVREDELPNWSPDGSKLAFARGAAGSGRIWVMNADGSNPVQLTSGPGDDFGPAWSPDGRQIAFVRDFANGDRSVWTMNANGSNQQRLLPIPLTEYVPTWAGSARFTDDNDGVATLGVPAQGLLRPASAQATRRAAPVTTTIKVTTFNSSYHLSAKTAPRGVVIFKVTNKAVFGHDFSITGHTTKVLKTGQSATLRVTFLKPGHYVYKDTLDHHVQWGDIGGFTIT